MALEAWDVPRKPLLTPLPVGRKSVFVLEFFTSGHMPEDVMLSGIP